MAAYNHPFRATLGYTGDIVGDDPVCADSYNAGTGRGWTTAVDSRDRSAANPDRLEGINFQSNNGTQAIFRRNLPSSGQYYIKMASGDQAGAQGKQYVQVRDSDNTTVLFTINASLYAHLPFNFLRDMDPVGGFIRVPNVMEVPVSLPVKTVGDFIAYVKKNPGKVNMASSGSGTSRRPYFDFGGASLSL